MGIPLGDRRCVRLGVPAAIATAIGALVDGLS